MHIKVVVKKCTNCKHLITSLRNKFVQIPETCNSLKKYYVNYYYKHNMLYVSWTTFFMHIMSIQIYDIHK